MKMVDQLSSRISSRCLQSGLSPLGILMTLAMYSTHRMLVLQSSCSVSEQRILMACSLVAFIQGMSSSSSSRARYPRDSRSSLRLSGSPLSWLLLAKGEPLNWSTTSSGCPRMSTYLSARLKSMATSCPSSLIMKCSGSMLRQRQPQSWMNSRILRMSMRRLLGGSPTMLPLFRSMIMQVLSSRLKSSTRFTHGHFAFAMFFHSRSYTSSTPPSPSAAYFNATGCEFRLEYPQKTVPKSGSSNLQSRTMEQMVLRFMLPLWQLEWLFLRRVWMRSERRCLLELGWLRSKVLVSGSEFWLRMRCLTSSSWLSCVSCFSLEWNLRSKMWDLMRRMSSLMAESCSMISCCGPVSMSVTLRSRSETRWAMEMGFLGARVRLTWDCLGFSRSMETVFLPFTFSMLWRMKLRINITYQWRYGMVLGGWAVVLGGWAVVLGGGGYIVMQQIFPKVTQVFSYHLKNFEVINCLMSSISLRVDAEEQYERAITRAAQKVSEIQTDHPLYSKIITSFKGLISERIHQVRYFKEQIAKEADLLKQALDPVEQAMRAHLADLRAMEKDLRATFDALTKSRNNLDSKYKELDERFILSEVAALHKMNKGLRKNSEAVLREEQSLMKMLEGDWQRFREGLGHFEGGAQERERKIWELDIRVEEQFVDFFKKLNVHEISLIRNIQYDIDNMIKKTDIFNWQNTNQFQDRFSLRADPTALALTTDPYAPYKNALLAEEELLSPKVDPAFDPVRLEMLKGKLADPKQAEEMLQEIRKNYQHYRGEICEFIESFRKSGVFKFQVQAFRVIVGQLREILRAASAAVDFECIQKLILYSNSYHCPNYANGRKRTALEELKQEKLFSDLAFWKFFLLYSIRAAAAAALNQKEEREVHTRSGVYSVLLSNSLTMVDCGLEKHNIKNLIGKLAKTFGSLTEAQVAELLKVIETAHESFEKGKKK